MFIKAMGVIGLFLALGTLLRLFVDSVTVYDTSETIAMGVAAISMIGASFYLDRREEKRIAMTTKSDGMSFVTVFTIILIGLVGRFTSIGVIDSLLIAVAIGLLAFGVKLLLKKIKPLSKNDTSNKIDS